MKNQLSRPKFALTKTIVTRFTRPGGPAAQGKSSSIFTSSIVAPGHQR